MIVQEADQYLEWRGGLVQKKEAEERRQRMKEEVRGRGWGSKGEGSKGRGQGAGHRCKCKGIPPYPSPLLALLPCTSPLKTAKHSRAVVWTLAPYSRLPLPSPCQKLPSHPPPQAYLMIARYILIFCYIQPLCTPPVPASLPPTPPPPPRQTNRSHATTWTAVTKALS